MRPSSEISDFFPVKASCTPTNIYFVHNSQDYIMATAFLDQDIGRKSSPLSRCQSADCVATKKSFMTATNNGTIKASKGATKIEKVVQPTVNDTFRGVNLSTIPMLPESINLAYLAEGAANIIYRFSLPRGFSEPDGVLKFGVDKTHLLRLRKALPSGSPNLPAFAALQKVFFPLFPTEFILDTQIVRIPEGLIERENVLLKQREQSGHRIEKRAGLYLVGPPPPPGTPIDENGEKSTQYERYGFLVEDMTPASPTTNSEHGKIRREVLVEFKPKWLAQSSSAPSGSRRCRTCALRIAKEFKKHGTVIPGNGSGNPGHWCPFDLASGDAHRVRLAVRGMLSRKGAVLTGWKKSTGAKGEVNAYEAIILEDKLVRYFTNSKGKKLLDLLKKFQATWDPRGPVSIFGENGDQNTEPVAVEDGRDGEWGDEWTTDVKHFLMAMTIRDLTLFLKVCDINPGVSSFSITDYFLSG